MTEIMVARRDGTVRAPSGERFRLIRGKTLADARHPAVVGCPDAFMPMEVHLSVEAVDPGYLEDAFTVELAEAQEAARRAGELAEGYRQQLTMIADIVVNAGMVSPDTDTDKPGWVAESVRHVVELLTGTPAPNDVPPPRSRARAKNTPAKP